MNLTTPKEIDYATKIEEVQSAVVRSVQEMVNRYGRSIVSDALEWVLDILKTEVTVRKVENEENREQEN